MSAKHWQDHEIQFRKKLPVNPGRTEFPEARGLVVYLYAGTIEDCIKRARDQFNLGLEWEVVSCTAKDCLRLPPLLEQ
jgi:hypothetical protein